MQSTKHSKNLGTSLTPFSESDGGREEMAKSMDLKLKIAPACKNNQEFLDELRTFKHVLVVETTPGKYPPLGIMKLIRFMENHNITFTNVVGRYRLDDPKTYDAVVIGSGEFSYYHEEVRRTVQYYIDAYSHAKIYLGGVYASTGPFEWVEEAGHTVIRGTIDALDYLLPAYEYYKWNKVAYVFTTRGCVRTCSFCFVPKTEPDYGAVKGWHVQIPQSFNHVMIHDNNIWAFGRKWFEGVCDTIIRAKWRVVFDNGFDCRLTNDSYLENLERLAKQDLICHTGIRMAFDGPDQDGPCQETIEKISSFFDPAKIMVYILAGFDSSTRTDCMYRAFEVYRHGGRPVIQRYLPLTWYTDPKMYEYKKEGFGPFDVEALEKHWNVDMDTHGYPYGKSYAWHEERIMHLSEAMEERVKSGDESGLTTLSQKFRQNSKHYD